MTGPEAAQEPRERVEALREARRAARERLDELDAERRELLRDLLAQGYSRTQIAEWEGVSAWAITQAVRKTEGSPSRAGEAATLGGLT